MTHILEGKTINEIKIANDKMAILFQTDQGDIIGRADGDCCSQRWIEHVTLPCNGFPCVVLSTEERNLDKDIRDNDGELIQFYGFSIKTDRGDIEIDYRNSSNGYYGGNLSFDDRDFYGGVFEQNISTCQWINIKE